MKLQARAQEVITLLEKEYPVFETALDWEEPWQLVAAVLLSAQTTDENINRVTKTLFKKYPTPQAIANASIKELEQDIYSTGYYKAKAKNLKGMCTALVTEHNGVVPDSLAQLITLPGVGRKTANVVLHVLHDKREGIVMDTHIARVTHRLGFTKEKHPLKGEQTMMRILPNTQWKEWGDLLIQHGRKVCHARKPHCEKCVLSDICPTGKTILKTRAKTTPHPES